MFYGSSVSQRRSAEAVYPAGSVVICPDCWKPIFVLERGLGGADRGGRAASAFRPLRAEDCRALLARDDIDAGWRVCFRDWCDTPEYRALIQADRPRSGDPMVCPLCAGVYGRFTAEDDSAGDDRAYTVQLATIAPMRSTPTSWIGVRTRWIHDVPDEPMAVVRR